MDDSIEFRTNNVLPLMNIERASYGHPRDDRKVTNLNSRSVFTSNIDTYIFVDRSLLM